MSSVFILVVTLSKKPKQRESTQEVISPTEIPINLRPIDKSHTMRLRCHIPNHHGQIPSHLCALQPMFKVTLHHHHTPQLSHSY